MKGRSNVNFKGTRDRGSMEQETKIANNDGDIMEIAQKEVISIPPTRSIKDTAKIMMEHEFRRLPITDSGSGKLLGIVTVMDILDFLGGGQKFKIIQNKYDDNFLAAINEPIRQIMVRDVICASNKDSMEDAVALMLNRNIGAIPVVDADKKLVGIVTERDFALTLAGVLTDELVRDYMTEKVITTTPGTPIEGASKIMVRNGLRRIPIIGGDIDDPDAGKKLLGIITSTDIVNFFNNKNIFDGLNSANGSDVLDKKVSEIMAKDVVSIEPLTRLGDVCKIFKDINIGGLPVVKDEKLFGIITERDVLKAIVK